MRLDTCEPQEWRDHWAELAASGTWWFDFMAGVDRGSSIEVIGRVARVPGGEGNLLSTSVTSQTLDSVSCLFPAAAWYEREIAEMLGVEFSGLEDARPLLRRSTVASPPLLKSSVLAARAVRPWPGAVEGGGGRRVQPPGVPAGWLKEHD